MNVGIRQKSVNYLLVFLSLSYEEKLHVPLILRETANYATCSVEFFRILRISVIGTAFWKVIEFNLGDIPQDCEVLN